VGRGARQGVTRPDGRRIPEWDPRARTNSGGVPWLPPSGLPGVVKVRLIGPGGACVLLPFPCVSTAHAPRALADPCCESRGSWSDPARTEGIGTVWLRRGCTRSAQCGAFSLRLVDDSEAGLTPLLGRRRHGPEAPSPSLLHQHSQLLRAQLLELPQRLRHPMLHPLGRQSPKPD